MDNSELKTIVNAQIRSAMGYMGGELSTQRAEAMDYYLGEPFGNEMEGRSSVISRDVAETIEWIMPSLMRIFSSSDKAVEFEASGPEDEPQAEQETDYCNYIFYRRNDGFLILYTWFKDALLSKNGIVKPYCEEKEEVTKEEYRSLTEDEYMILLNDPELEALEHSERIESLEVQPGMSIQYPVHDVKFRRTKKSHDKIVANVPPEEFLISSKANSVDPKKAPFSCHRSRKPISDLIEMGYDEKLLETIPSEDKGPLEQEFIARHNLTDERNLESLTQEDKSMREIWVYECYLKVDYDGDGIAELRKVTLAGNEILDNEEVDSVPFCSLTPIILTHKFFGLSIADLVKDLQLIKSTIWRQILDNLYINNNQMIGADANVVNLDDLLTRRPGGVVRTIGSPANALFPIPPNALPSEAFSMIEYIDTVKETRTGVGKQFQGLNADVLKEANIPAIQGLLSAAQQRVEMIARIFAETGVKQMFLDIHQLVRKYPNKPEVVKLRNKWVPVDPREWRERTSMIVSVGLGSASKDQQILSINGVLSDQMQAMESGGGMLVSPKNRYNALKKKTAIAGFQNADEFWTDPDTVQPSPPPPDPNMEAIKAQVHIEEQKRQVEMQKMQAENELKFLDLQFRAQDAERKAQIEQLKAEIAIMAAQQKAAADQDKLFVDEQANRINEQLKALELALSEQQHQRDTALEAYKAELQTITDQMLETFNHNITSAQQAMQHGHEKELKAMDMSHQKDLQKNKPKPTK